MPPKKKAAKKAPSKAPAKPDASATEEIKEVAPKETEPEVPNIEETKPDETKAEETTTEDPKPKEIERKEPKTKPSNAKKRKQPADDAEPEKSGRRSGRSAPRSQPSHIQLLNFMLSPASNELCSPPDEISDIQDRGPIRTYTSSVLSPFEELLCAVVLSRPISHRLGLRTIRTILNEPYNFTNAKAVQAAGDEKRHQALWDARTQHKAKTAEQIGLVADAVLEKFTSKGDKDGSQMQGLLGGSSGDVDQALDTLKSSIKGLGATGLDIFLRRVQWLWTEGFPYIDASKTALSLRKLGLPEEAEDLRKAIDGNWSKLGTKNLAGQNEAAKKRRAFVVVLERAVGSDLEGKVDEVMAAAAGQ